MTNLPVVANFLSPIKGILLSIIFTFMENKIMNSHVTQAMDGLCPGIRCWNISCPQTFSTLWHFLPETFFSRVDLNLLFVRKSFFSKSKRLLSPALCYWLLSLKIFFWSLDLLEAILGFVKFLLPLAQILEYFVMLRVFCHTLV